MTSDSILCISVLYSESNDNLRGSSYTPYLSIPSRVPFKFQNLTNLSADIDIRVGTLESFTIMIDLTPYLWAFQELVYLAAFSFTIPSVTGFSG